jgi:TRAP-type C4-dicarboxylate transport system substrate-binding protein
VTVGAQQWAKLPAETRAKIEAIAQGMQEFVYQKAAQLDDELLDKMKGSVEINNADKDAFIAASSAIYEEFGKTVPGGAELVQQAVELGKIYK